MLLKPIIERMEMCNMDELCVSMEGECDWIKYKKLKN